MKSIGFAIAALALALSLLVAPAPLVWPQGSGSGPSPPSNDDLIGIWTFETTFGAGLKGDLAIEREGKTWRATIAGAATTFEVPAREVRFAFPGDSGRFRGALGADDGSGQIEGLWIRPGVTDDPRYPGGSSQPFATPVVLKPAGPDGWRGVVHPLPDSMTLYLRIFRNDEGALLGAFRNPDQGRYGDAMQFRVAREGNQVRFSAQPDPEAPEIRLEATLVRADVLSLRWPHLDRTIELTRRTPSQAPAFYPRPPDAPAYLYRSPPVTGDEWATARARDVGIDEDSLTTLVRRLAGADPSIRRPSLIHSLLVARRGKLVLEEYFYGFDRDQTHDTRSAGKMFASVMLGAAMMRGEKLTPDSRIYEVLAARGPFANPDPRKSKITLAHLMTHTSGLACNDNDDASPGNEDTMQSQRQQPDWWRFTLDLPMAHEPGTRYAYCSANMNLMGAALTVGTGTWLPEFFDRTVARPLDFGPYHWNLQPTDEGYLGGGAWLRPRDLLKIGQAYLDGGTWRGRRIVDSSWVTQSTAPRFHISPVTTGLSEEQFGDFYGEADDAYAWHLGGVTSGGRNYPGYAATGNGGQVLLVVPELELAVVFTGGNFRQGGIWTRWGGQIVGEGIIPTMQK